MPDSIQGAGHGERHRSDSSLPEPASWGQGTHSGENKCGTWREGLGRVGVYPNLGLRENLSEEEYFELRQGKKPPPSFTEGTAGTEGLSQEWPWIFQSTQRSSMGLTKGTSKSSERIPSNHPYFQNHFFMVFHEDDGMLAKPYSLGIWQVGFLPDIAFIFSTVPPTWH